MQRSGFIWPAIYLFAPGAAGNSPSLYSAMRRMMLNPSLQRAATPPAEL
jgi:hypothetical protein